MTTREHVVCLALLSLVACGGAQNLPTQLRHADGCGGKAATRGHVEVYLSLWEPSGERPFCPGDHLHPGDALQLSVEVVEPAHLHLLYLDPHGESGVLARQDAGEVTRKGIYRLPAGLLTKHVGEAQLFLIVSLDPLEESDPAMFDLWQAIRQTGTFVDRDGHLHPPEHGRGRSEPLHFDGVADLHANFDAKGVAMLALPLRTGD